MLRPSTATQMVTPMQIQIPKSETILGVQKKTYVDDEIITANFKTYGGTESVSNDILSVIDTAQITCWYNPKITSDCRLKRLPDGAIFEVIGEPENLEMRYQILYFKVRRVKGKA